jgi:hypothetical protein
MKAAGEKVILHQPLGLVAEFRVAATGLVQISGSRLLIGNGDGLFKDGFGDDFDGGHGQGPLTLAASASHGRL